jgi:universal stress protein A
MSSARMNYQRLLATVDLGEMTEPVVKRAVELARRLSAAVDVATILERTPGYLKHTLSPDELQATEDKSTHWIHGRLEELKTRYPEVGATHTARGILAEALRHLAKEVDADLLVLGAAERQGMAVLFGDRSDEILHKAPCDVLLVKDRRLDQGSGSPRPYRRVVAAVDLGVDGAFVLERAALLAARCEADLILIHVIDHFPVDRSNALIAPEDKDPLVFERDEADRRLRELATQAGVGNSRVEVLASPSTASREIPEFAKRDGADLVIAGSHGRHGLGRFLGSTADGIRHRARCDVLVVRVPMGSDWG